MSGPTRSDGLAGYFATADVAREGLLARFSDLFLVAGIVAIVALMVLPLPLWLIDLLVAVNIASGLVLILLAVYVAGPLEFSVFPSVLLMTTLFRLALSIATTRMILLHADGGHIIATFGKLVAGGNLVVGLVVFLIITVVQFIVIAKGAERVAEVAARFSLDAMPGKQLSIDSDLRSGLIDKDEAKRRRRTLELESKLHGSLDGAMKFVKGDAIAGIVIILINLLGGLAIGVLQQDLSVGDAVHRYSILSIGEGMVAQIPALLGAMAAGLLVTRTNDDEHDRHLGDAIRKQIGAKPRVHLMAAAICLLLATVPGFPPLVFGLLAVVFAAAGVMLLPQGRDWVARRVPGMTPRASTTEATALKTAPPRLRPSVPLLLEVPQALLADGGVAVTRAVEDLIDELQLDLGLPLPRMALHGRLGQSGWRLLAHEVPLAEGAQAPDAATVATAVRDALRRNAALFIGIQETSELLTRAQADLADVVKEVLRALPVQKVTEVLRRLAAETVSIRNLRDILEALADASQREKDVQALTEMTRIALRRQTHHRLCPDGELRALMLSPELEQLMRQQLHVSGGVTQLAIAPDVARQFAAEVQAQVQALQPQAIVCAVDLRWHLRKLIENECFDTPVLSFHELLPTLRLTPLRHLAPPRLDAPASQTTLLAA
ncbi:flagellar biosynthesis protein FlhA [Roseateles puraquae]|uniref:Type III secretion protein n=1 Tax=Roseateles puraquae TaxID=431059 RepID=A0A254N8J8_9BURK|nr:flagellar biosynthesis protein FlhA [Roseateles puraquae]MDG0856472.1 type III secretion protein [Roseateles puraquae]OWR02687.1 type III secretion protein [Roseateles puraquae]